MRVIIVNLLKYFVCSGGLALESSGESPLTVRDFSTAVIGTSSGLSRFVTAVVNDRKERNVDSQPHSTAKYLPIELLIRLITVVTIPSGWCSAQRIKIFMIAGGNHTSIYSGQKRKALH